MSAISFGWTISLQMKAQITVSCQTSCLMQKFIFKKDSSEAAAIQALCYFKCVKPQGDNGEHCWALNKCLKCHHKTQLLYTYTPYWVIKNAKTLLGI